MGAAVGANSALVPLLLAEISPPPLRGAVVSFNQLLICTGVLLAYAVQIPFVAQRIWEGPIACGCALGLLQFVVCSVGVPESPRWLVMSGRMFEARRVLLRLRAGSSAEAVEAEMSEMEVWLFSLSLFLLFSRLC